MKILFIGDNSQELANSIWQQYPNAELAHNYNFEPCLTDHGVYYTGLGDLDGDQITKLALTCQRVIFCPDLPWEDSRSLAQTQHLCNMISHFRPVENFQSPALELFLTHDVQSKFEQPTVWSFGCSFTRGYALDDATNQVYGALVADHLGMPLQNISQGGSSIRWSLTHLLHADFGPDDLVIWGCTLPGRIRRATQHIQPQEVRLAENASSVELEYFNTNQVLFEYMDCVNIGMKYLQTKKNKCVLICFAQTDSQDHLGMQLGCYPQYCDITKWGQFPKAKDGRHPGPEGHKYVANRIIDHVQLLNYV